MPISRDPYRSGDKSIRKKGARIIDGRGTPTAGPRPQESRPGISQPLAGVGSSDRYYRERSTLTPTTPEVVKAPAPKEPKIQPVMQAPKFTKAAKAAEKVTSAAPSVIKAASADDVSQAVKTAILLANGSAGPVKIMAGGRAASYGANQQLDAAVKSGDLSVSDRRRIFVEDAPAGVPEARRNTKADNKKPAPAEKTRKKKLTKKTSTKKAAVTVPDDEDDDDEDEFGFDA